MLQSLPSTELSEKRVIRFLKFSNIYKNYEKYSSGEKDAFNLFLKASYNEYIGYLCDIYYENLPESEKAEIDEEIHHNIGYYLQRRYSVTYNFFFNRERNKQLENLIDKVTFDEFIKILGENRKNCISKFELSKLTEKRAQTIYEDRNKNKLPGNSITDWLQAEEEIKNKYIVVV